MVRERARLLRLAAALHATDGGARCVFVFEHVFDGHQQRDIAVMDADGHNVTNLTSSASDDVSPAWSRDGTRIAFAVATTDASDGG